MPNSITGTHLVTFYCSNVEKSHLKITSKMNLLYIILTFDLMSNQFLYRLVLHCLSSWCHLALYILGSEVNSWITPIKSQPFVIQPSVNSLEMQGVVQQGCSPSEKLSNVLTSIKCHNGWEWFQLAVILTDLTELSQCSFCDRGWRRADGWDHCRRSEWRLVHSPNGRDFPSASGRWDRHTYS